jgi:hypothetical protein
MGVTGHAVIRLDRAMIMPGLAPGMMTRCMLKSWTRKTGEQTIDDGAASA